MPFNSTFHSHTASKREYAKIVSDEDLQLFFIVNFYTFCTVICVCGIVANVINIIVFHKQGFANTMNISLLALTISDLCSQVTVLWTNMVLCGMFDNLGFVRFDVIYLTGGHTRVVFARITGWITVFITVERCLCITIPLKIKQIITPGRTKMIICGIYILMILSLQPEFLAAYLCWKVDVNSNKTILGMVFTSIRKKILGLTFYIYVILGIASFIIIIVFTIILVFKLKQTSQWRQKATNEVSRLDAASRNEKKTVPMVVMISTVLIICYTPSVVVSLVTCIEPEFHVHGFYVNTVITLWSFSYVFESLNSSVNIFLYYFMSSKYRETFNNIFVFGDSIAKLKR